MLRCAQRFLLLLFVWFICCTAQIHFQEDVDMVPCDTKCMTPIPAEWTPSGFQSSCGQNGVTYNNSLCPATLWSYNYCLVKFNVTGIRYAGACGCPNDCFQATNQGECQNDVCTCSPGWKGPDCSQVDCEHGPNKCSNHGVCVSVNGTDWCQCDSSWTGASCETAVIHPPAVNETVPSTQYSSWDKYGNNHPIFNVSVIAQIKLYMAPDALEFIINPLNKQTSEYQHAELLFDNGVTKKKIQDVGIRIHGNISRACAKKTYKIAFNAFRNDDDNDWDQIDGFSLKGFQTDNSYLRDPMSTAVEYSMNGYIQRFGWAQLTINDQSFGYYLVMEDVDKHYLHSRFGTNNGPLYKCTANLTWIGPEVESYESLEFKGTPCYDPKTDEAKDYTLLRDLLAVLHFTPSEELPKALEHLFDVDLFIRTFVFEVATGNYDGLRNQNNFYLFKNPDDGLWKYIRHDNDFTFGSWPVVMPLDSNDIYNWADIPHGSDGKFLYDRILSVPEFKTLYSQYLQDLWNSFFFYDENSDFYNIAMQYQNLCNVPASQDYAHYLDSALTYYTFTNSYNETYHKPASPEWSGQVLSSFTGYMSERKQTAQQQLDSFFGY